MGDGFTAEVRQLSAQPTVCARIKAPTDTLGELFGRLLGASFQALGAAGVAPGGAPYGRYFSFDPVEVDCEIGVPVAAPIAGMAGVGSVKPGEVGAGELPATKAAVTTHVGSYDGLSATYEKLQSWMIANGHAAAGAPWESYVDDPGDMSDMTGVRTEICWPIA